MMIWLRAMQSAAFNHTAKCFACTQHPHPPPSCSPPLHIAGRYDARRSCCGLRVRATRSGDVWRALGSLRQLRPPLAVRRQIRADLKSRPSRIAASATARVRARAARARPCCGAAVTSLPAPSARHAGGQRQVEAQPPHPIARRNLVLRHALG